MTLDLNAIRTQFPALQQTVGGVTPVFFDNPAGTQVPQRTIDAVRAYYTDMNANAGGAFVTSQRSDAMVAETRVRMADFLNAPDPADIVFGPNMTTLNFALSRALARNFSSDDEIVVTRMDHDANVAPWLHVAADHNLTVKWVDINPADCTLDMDSLEAALSERTKIVATVHASNAVGTINPIPRIAEMAHAAGALHIVDAVQSAPHIPIDVQALGCDFLLCSAYKFFGPHLGIMWGKHDLLADLPAYKVRPAKDKPPYRWETGTPTFELISALGATLDYLTEIGREYGMPYKDQFPGFGGRQIELKAGMAALQAYERELVTHLIEMLQTIPGVTIWGITDPARYAERVPTVVFTHEQYTAEQIAAHCGQQQIFVWDGNYYAQEIMERLGFAAHGMVRVGLAHYNTHDEIDRLEAALQGL